MRPLEWSDADEARAASFGGYLASSYGVGIRPLTPEEASYAATIKTRLAGDAGGSCLDCGKPIPRKRWYCDEHRDAHRRDTMRRHQADLRAKRKEEGIKRVRKSDKTGTCECGQPKLRTSVVCRDCWLKEKEQDIAPWVT